MIVLVAAFFVSPFTLSSLRQAHFLWFLPFALILLAQTPQLCLPKSRHWQWAPHGLLLVWVIIGVLDFAKISRNFNADINPDRNLRGNDVFYLADSILKQSPRRIFAFGWSAISGMQYLSAFLENAPELVSASCPGATGPAVREQLEHTLVQAQEGDYMIYSMQFCPSAMIDLHKNLAGNLGKRMNRETLKLYPAYHPRFEIFRISRL